MAGIARTARWVAVTAASAWRIHPRLCAALGLGAAGFLAMPWLALRLRFLLAFDLAATAWLALAMMLVASCDAQAVRRRANLDDEGAWVALVLAFAIMGASLGAVVVEAGAAKGVGDPTLHVSVAALTLVLSWLFFHSLSAFHYAHTYYDDAPDATPMLAFPGRAEPDYWDFLYFAFNLGTSCQTADVSINSPRLRRFVLFHQVASYIYNAMVLALGVNVAAGIM